ncbi:MAG: SAM-dependent methyltransferase [Desulfarculus sp.]|nr:MAG: SAM-dependent methyltransferase [Desulfarculus sp.]
MGANPSGPRRLGASFRDPAGFVFARGGTVYRQVNQAGAADYDLLLSSGLYQELAQAGLLIPHEEAPLALALAPGAYKVIQPQAVPFVSYPYEWCFGQLKDAALATLEVQRRALARGLCLKDASAFNLQFLEGRPRFIDTLSFERYQEGRPWVAYQQFCRHFLAPLALMALRDWRLGRLSRLHLEGLPLDLAQALLPRRALLRPGLLMHIGLHAKSQARFGGRKVEVKDKAFSGRAMLGLVESLRGAVRGLSWRPQGTQWAAYYEDTNYSERAAQHKAELVRDMLAQAAPQTVWDLGGNTGRYSRVAAEQAGLVVSFDLDMAAVEQNYRRCQQDGERRILPLVMDLNNPSPALGWDLAERDSLAARGPADAALALALVHHLAIGNNLPYGRIAELLARLARWLVVEYIPPDDSQAQRLLANREAAGLHDLGPEAFAAAFGRCFQVVQTRPLAESGRLLYLMRYLGGSNQQ